MDREDIKKLRLDMGRSQAEMAKVVGSSRATVNRWETGETKPLPKFVNTLEKLWRFTYGAEYEKG